MAPISPAPLPSLCLARRRFHCSADVPHRAQTLFHAHTPFVSLIRDTDRVAARSASVYYVYFEARPEAHTHPLAALRATSHP